VLKSGCRWKDCPEAYGPSTTIYNRFNRWARRGIWENLLRALAGLGRSADTQMIDSTHIKAHRSASGGKGEKKQAVGGSRGGRNTKIHALADAKGRLLAILLTGGEAHDCPVAPRLLRRVKSSKYALGDKAYDSKELREELDERGTTPVSLIECAGNSRSVSTNGCISFDGGSRVPLTGSRTSDASPRVMISWRVTNFLASICLAAVLVWWT
jgi:transposase